MITLDTYDVKIFTDRVEPGALDQLRGLMAIPAFAGCRVRVMPDVHAGAGCVIGFTGDLGEKVVPNIVGVDIGCGILVQPLGALRHVDGRALTAFIRAAIPSGRDFRDARYRPLPVALDARRVEAKRLVTQLRCYRELRDVDRIRGSIGSLGGGNHFIEVDRDSRGRLYLLVHTGSRNLGKQVACLYQKLAVKCLSGWGELMREQERLIAAYKAAGRRGELQEAIRRLRGSFRMRPSSVHPDLAWLEGRERDDYLHDMRLCQRWAAINRRLVADLILGHLSAQPDGLEDSAALRAEAFESVHNYIGEDNVIRKGAISARRGERCIIPLNMRDGALLATGRGNADWNHSAPHGAGRVMSRREAFERITMADYGAAMAGVYSETVTPDTRDEAPMAYKPVAEIRRYLSETVDVDDTLRPLFNFKAAE